MRLEYNLNIHRFYFDLKTSLTLFRKLLHTFTLMTYCTSSELVKGEAKKGNRNKQKQTTHF
jgi:hypothetical protein